MSSCINPNKLNQILNLEAHFFDSVKCVAFHPNQPYFATGSNDRTAKVWRLSPDYSSATLVAILKGHTQDITSVAFHPTDLLLATASDDNTVRLWRVFPDSSSATCVAILRGHSEYVTCVAFHPTGQFLATGSWDKTVILWRLSPDNSSATCVKTLTGHSGWVNCVAFDPTGRVLASGSDDKTVRLWQLSSDYSSASCMNILTGHTHNVLSVAFHPKEPLLTSSSYDDTAKMWEMSSDNSSVSCVETLDDHRSPVFCVAFHPFNGTLATGGFDHCARLWRSNKMTSKSEERQQKSILDILPTHLLVAEIMTKAPQLGTACKSLHAFLPKIDRKEYSGIRFPSPDTKPTNLIGICHDGLTFSYQKPKDDSSRLWNGCKPSIHTPARMLPLCEYPCDFCNEKDQRMTIQGSNIHGVLFVCPECKHGLTTRLKEILGETLWELIDTNRQIMVPRTNGPNEFWYVSSRLPVIHHGTWRLRVQSHLDLMNGECLEKAVRVEKLKELNEAVPA